MFSPGPFLSPGRAKVSEFEEDDNEEFAERLCKTLYYGKPPSTDRPSLPLTDIAVEFFQEAAPRKLGKLDTYLASSTSRSACMSPCSVMVGMLYVKRLKKHNPTYLQQISSSELFLISMMMASKFMYDEGVEEEVFNDEWAESADLEPEDVNQMEREFLSAIDWQLFVYQREFAEVLRLIEQQIALRQGRDRGWFSYTDLYLLSQNPVLDVWKDLATDFSKVIAVSSLAYLAGILTMIGSTILVTTASSTLIAMAPGVLLPTTKLVARTQVLPVLPPDLVSQLTCNLTSDPPNSDHDQLSACVKSSVTLTSDLQETSEMTKLDGELRNTETYMEKGKENINESESWTDVLSPLFALLALKETFVSFVMAVNEKHDWNKSTAASSAINTGLVCSEGPCPLESWTDCWNVSSEMDNSFDSESEAEFGSERSHCCGNCGRHQSQMLQPSFGYGQNSADVKGCHVRCCCGTGLKDAVLDSRDISFMNKPFEDLYVGFSTRPRYQMYLTT